MVKHQPAPIRVGQPSLLLRASSVCQARDVTRHIMRERCRPRGSVGLMGVFRRPAAAAPPSAVSATRDAPMCSARPFTVHLIRHQKEWSTKWTQPDGAESRLMSTRHDALGSLRNGRGRIRSMMMSLRSEPPTTRHPHEPHCHLGQVNL